MKSIEEMTQTELCAYAYYHWGDRQCLTQAIMVAEQQEIDIEEIRRWSDVEGKLQEFENIKEKLVK